MAGRKTTAPRKSTSTTELATFGPPVNPSATQAAFVDAEPEVSATDERRARELEDILDALGTDGQVVVYHVINGKTTYAGNMTMDGFTLASLMDNYGGGDKTLVFMQGNRKVDTIRIPLDPAIPPTSPRAKEMARQTAMGNVAPAPAPPPPFDVAGMISAQAAQFGVMMQASQQQTATMMATFTGLLTAMMTNKTDPTESFVKMLAILKEHGGTGGNGVGPEQVMALIEKGMSIGSRLNGEQDDVMGMVGKGLDTLGTIVSAMVQKRATPEPVAVVPAPLPNAPQAIAPALHEAPTIVAEGATITSHEEINMGKHPAAPVIRPWVDALRPFVPMLAGVVGKMDANDAADVMVERLSEAELDDMIRDIKAPDFAARLGTYFPAEIQQIANMPGGPEWLGKVLESVLEYEGGDESDSNSPDGEGSRDAEKNEGAG